MTPYSAAGRDYLDAGWSPIPLPYRGKFPPPDGCTGAGGRYVDGKMVSDWTRGSRPKYAQAGNLSFPPGNIALRLPKTIIGIDIDRYGSKAGSKTINKATKDWDRLPDTWASTSRQDGSGIYLFTVPEGLAWPGQVGPGVELLRWDHRYAVVFPSMHPEKRMYMWIRPDGVIVDDEIPSVADIPDLPPGWVKGLTGGKAWVPHPADDEMSKKDATAWLEARKAGMCEGMSLTLTRYMRELRMAGDEGGAHDCALRGAWALIGDSAAGHGGVLNALAKMRKVFVIGVGARREKGSASGEWTRIVIRGVQKVSAEGPPETDDVCDLLQGSSERKVVEAATKAKPGKAKAGASSSAFDYERDDIGNAQRLLQRVGSDARYVPGWQGWATYDPETSLWVNDPEDGPIRREMMAVVRAMATEAAFIEDPKAAATFLAHVRASGNIARIRAAVDLARGMKGVVLPAEAFNADPEILVCSNGAVELLPGGYEFRGTRHEDYATYSTDTKFDPEAKLGDWDKFIERVLPDKEDCEWVQTLAGYSLLGANPERILVIAKGQTSSGKTTFVEAMMDCLGRYASAFNLSIFREKQDESPRTDIVDSLSHRLIVASEASARWFLHADAVKRFTGGDRIKARRLNSNVFVQRQPAFTPWLATNSYPQIPDADKALWRRLKSAPFRVEMPDSELDKGLRGRLATGEGRAAVLAWLLAGWQLYAANGLGAPSPASLAILLEARDEMSDLDAALAATCVTGGDLEAPAMSLYRAYRIWIEQNGDERNILSITQWGKHMSAKGFEKFRARDEDGRFWYRRGLELREEWARVG